jgi:hypothetical protein
MPPAIGQSRDSGAQGGALEGYGLIGGSPFEPGSLQKFVVDFMQATCRRELSFPRSVSLGRYRRRLRRADGETPDGPSPIPLARCLHLLFDTAYTGAGETVAWTDTSRGRQRMWLMTW